MTGDQPAPSLMAEWLRGSILRMNEVLARAGAAADPVPEAHVDTSDLALRRRESGLTRRELAERTGMPIGTLARRETSGRVPAGEVDAIERELTCGRPTRVGDGTRRGVANLGPQAAPGEGERVTVSERAERTAKRLRRSARQGEDPVTPEELREVIASTGSSYSKLSDALGIKASRLAGWGAGYNPIPPRFWPFIRAYRESNALHEQSAGPLTPDVLLDVRAALGLSQTQLCALTGDLFTDQALRAYEHGEREIPREAQDALRDALERAAGLSSDSPPEERAAALEEVGRPARRRRLSADRLRREALERGDLPVTRDELKDVLRRSGLLQRELADRLGVQKAVVDRWARGTHQPAPEFWELIREIGRTAAVPAGARPITGREVRALRLARGLSRPQLAKRLGVPLHRVEGWEDKGISVRPHLWQAVRRELEAEPVDTG